MKNLIILFLLALSFSVNAKIIYLSPTGNDNNNGSINSPYFSLNKAWSVVAAGDTIYLRGGVYRQTIEQRLYNKNGTANKLIKVWNYPGEVPNITPASSYSLRDNHELIYGLWNYVHWKGLEISGLVQTQGAPVWSAFRCGEGSNNIYENIRYYNNCAGFRLMGENSTNNLVLNCDFFNTKDPYGVDGNGFEPYGAGDGFAANEIGTNTTLTIRGCRFYDNSDDGMDLFNFNGFATIQNNWSFRNGFIPGTNNQGGDGSGYKFGHMPNWFNGAWPANTLKRVITNNLSAYNRVSGFNEAGLYAGAQLYNNTTISEGYLNFYFDYGYGNGYRDFIYYFTNNISYNAQNNWLNSYIVYKTNTFNPVASDFLSLDVNLLTTARQADGSLPVVNFARLSANSSLINAGTNVGLPYSGSAPDIGAFETGITTPPPSSYTSTKSGSFTRNNCPPNNTAGSATYTATATSTVSQADADAKATADVVANGQAYANANASCTPIIIVPPPVPGDTTFCQKIVFALSTNQNLRQKTVTYFVKRADGFYYDNSGTKQDVIMYRQSNIWKFIN